MTENEKIVVSFDRNRNPNPAKKREETFQEETAGIRNRIMENELFSSTLSKHEQKRIIGMEPPYVFSLADRDFLMEIEDWFL